MHNNETVLVTGGSGFVGVHALLQLLTAGYRVRTTVRHLRRESDVRAMLKEGGIEPGERLSFHAADLEKDEGWKEATSGCAYVLHVASPFPLTAPKNENALIIPAREGTLRVLRASRDAGVKRVVLTSSFAAVGFGQEPGPAPFTEESWTRLDDPGMSAYLKSKTLAERAAWDFIAREGGGLELSVVNPVAVFGPTLGRELSTSILLVKQMMDGTLPAYPRLSLGLVDVRDVVDLHLRAMTHPAARGERFLAVAGPSLSMLEVARLLKSRLGAAASRVATRELPDWVVRLAALVDPTARQAVPELGKVKDASNEKARRLLGWAPRSNEEALLATAESLVRLGCLKNPPRKSAA